MKKIIVGLVRTLMVMLFVLPFVIVPVNASMVNNALNFDGVDDSVSVNPFPSAEGDITFSAWVKLDTATGFRTFAAWNYTGDSLVIRTDNGNLGLIFNNQILNGGSIPAGSWHHVAFTKSVANFNLYVNGVLKSSGPLGGSDQTFTAFQMGSLLGTMHYLDGEMDDVAVWSRVLTAEEIQSLKTAPLTGAEPNLMACYSFNENGGALLPDISLDVNDGTLNNFSLIGMSSNWVPSTVFSPSDITLTASSINENSAADSEIGTFGSADPEVGDTFTYTLVSGVGSTDNTAFNITGNSLYITSSPDYETKSSYSVRVRTTDHGGSIYEEAFTITINDMNEAPTNLTVSSSAINENVAANTAIGTFSTTDPDAGDTSTYTLVAGTGSTDNAFFNISGSSLRITDSPDYETKNSYSVRVRTTDQGGLFFEKILTITINDVNEAPTCSSVAVPSNGTYSTGQNLEFTVNFNKSVTVVGGTPYIPITLTTGGTVNAAYYSGSGTSTLAFRYTVQAGNRDMDGIAVGASITANGATLRDTASNNANLALNNIGNTTSVLVDAAVPIVLAVSVPVNSTYGAGHTLNFTVTYDEIINVDTAGGTPSIPVTLATGTVNAVYLSGSGTQNLVFRYTVADGNNDPDGVSVGSAIALNGSTLKNDSTVDADLNLNSVATTINVRVDALAPTATITAATAGGDALISASEKTAGFNVVARSSEGNGTLYVVPSATAKNMGAITGAAIGSAASAGANSDTTIAIAANNPGVINGFLYKVYAVDGAGNISVISGVAFTADFSGPTLTAGAMNRTSDTAGTVKFTSNEAGKYYYALVADGAAAPGIDTSGAGTDCTTAETTITNPTGLTTGAKDIYIVVKDAAGNVSSAIKMDIAAYAALDTTVPTLTAGAVTRTADTAGTVKFTSNEAGKYYYALVADGAAAPGVDTSGAGTDCTTAETTLTNPTGLTAGAKDIYIVVKDAAGNASNAMKIDIAAYVASSGGSSSGGGGGGGGGSSAPSQTPITIIVNGDGLSAGTSKDTITDGKTITTIILDEKKLEQKLGQAGSGAVVEVPADSNSGTIIGELNGQMVKNMENYQAVVEIKNHSATYTLPAKQINIDAVSQQIGTTVALKDIKVQIEIVKGNQGTATLMENAAKKGEFTIVAPPVEFNVRCTYAGKAVEVSKFNDYVERTVAIPDGVDPTKITTGVIVEADGTVRHVPTKITVINGKYYAKINSLTNSTYSVVYNPVAFKDVENHWAKASVNNMGSRMVVSGAGSGQFEPDRSITRAEFAAIVVRALGLKPGTGTNGFGDVNTADWYCKSIETASAYGIITGYDKVTFGPNEKITREQAMAMIARTLKTTGLKTTLESGEAEKLLSAYTDSALSSAWAQEGTATCIKSGIVSGKAPGVLAPQNEITRAEVAVIIERLLKKSGLI